MKCKVLLVAGVVGALLTGVTGCTGGRDYATPKKACGIPVDSSALSPLLPNGESLRQEDAGSVTAPHGCDVIVDKRRAVSPYLGYVDRLYDPISDVSVFKSTNRQRMKDLPFPGKGAVGDGNAVVFTPCGAPKVDYLLVEVTLDDTINKNVQQRRDNLERFATAYTPKAKEHLKCTE